jgi:hypothetical protein
VSFYTDFLMQFPNCTMRGKLPRVNVASRHR